MAKTALSVTLDEANLRWLRGQAATSRPRSVSAALDRIVTAARLGGHVHDASVRSVAGTVDISGDDPNLDTADQEIASLFARSLARPTLVRERKPSGKAGYGSPTSGKGKGGRRG